MCSVDLPAVTLCQSNQFRIQIQLVGDQRQDHRLAIFVGLPNIDLDHAQRLQ
jgi:hypothetical protein